MPFPLPISEALKNYDKNKGRWRKLFRFDQAAIRALRRLSDIEQTNLLKINLCFIENKPDFTQESHKVYERLLAYLNSIDSSSIPETMQQLHISKLLKPNNLDKLTQLKGNHFRQLAILLFHLKKQNLLTQENFDNIAAKHFETIAEHVSMEFNYLVEATKMLDVYLTQENFNCLLENPMVVNTLIILNSNLLLTSDNCSDLFSKNNQFLLSNKAYSLVWLPLKTYLSTLVDLDEKQWIFDRLTRLMQKENPEEKIKNFIDALNSEGVESTTHRNKSADKFFTAPPQRSKSRGSLHDLVNLSSDRPGTL